VVLKAYLYHVLDAKCALWLVPLVIIEQLYDSLGAGGVVESLESVGDEHLGASYDTTPPGICSQLWYPTLLHQ